MLKRCFMSLYMPTHHHPWNNLYNDFFRGAKITCSEAGVWIFWVDVGWRWEKAAGLHSAKQLGYLMGWQRIWLCVLVCTFLFLVERNVFFVFLGGEGTCRNIGWWIGKHMVGWLEWPFYNILMGVNSLGIPSERDGITWQKSSTFSKWYYSSKLPNHNVLSNVFVPC